MEILLLTLLLLRKVIEANTEEGNYTYFLSLEEKIPAYSGEKLFNHSCLPDEEAFEVVRDLQLSAQEKANYLHENLCKIDAKLICDASTRRCVCMTFGGNESVWDSARVTCFGLVGHSCKTFTKFHPGVSKRLMHKTECVVGASCANFVYDTTEVCQCDDENASNATHRCVTAKRSTAGINVRPSSFAYLLQLLMIIAIIFM